MPVMWPNAEQARFLAQAVNLYRAVFMGPYNFVEGYTRADFWEVVFSVYFDNFPEEDVVDKAKYAKAMLAREEVWMFSSAPSHETHNIPEANQKLHHVAGKKLDYLAINLDALQK
jgi:hypothetical protein